MRKNPAFLSFLLLPALLFMATAARAQQAGADVPDMMRDNGKMGVVVAVLAIIFAGIFAYLIRLDRRLSRLEREVR